MRRARPETTLRRTRVLDYVRSHPGCTAVEVAGRAFDDKARGDDVRGDLRALQAQGLVTTRAPQEHEHRGTLRWVAKQDVGEWRCRCGDPVMYAGTDGDEEPTCYDCHVAGGGAP